MNDKLILMAEKIGRVDSKICNQVFPRFCDGSEVGEILECSWMKTF